MREQKEETVGEEHCLNKVIQRARGPRASYGYVTQKASCGKGRAAQTSALYRARSQE